MSRPQLAQDGVSHPSAAVHGRAHPLSALVYRSWARRTLSDAELYRLAADAQARNCRESITGLMVYDNGRFFQWLEGPDESVDRVMDSIRNDPRHTGIEILHRRTAWERVFESWNMKLATRSARYACWQDDVLVPSPELVAHLHRHPEAAADALVTLLDPFIDDAAGAPFLSEPVTSAHLQKHVASVVKRVILSAVVPDLARRHGAPDAAGLRPVDPRVTELADLLLASDQGAARALIEELHAGQGWAVPLCSTVFEPAARRLGDLWAEDHCSEFDVTVGLCRIQAASRLLAHAGRRSAPRSQAASVLIAPEPGELHGLGAALDSDVLWNAGWAPRCERPADDRTLEDLVSASWFDVLDLSFSAAFQREHWLPRLTRTIARARLASRNPSLLVVVGGRIFAERRKSAFQVGADLTNVTASNLDTLILPGSAKH